MATLGEAVASLRRASIYVRRANGELMRSRAMYGGFQLSKSPEVAALQLETGPGRCCFCEEPLPEVRAGVGKMGRPPMRCAAQECKRSLARLLKRLHRDRNRKPRTPKVVAICRCGAPVRSRGLCMACYSREYRRNRSRRR